MSVPAARLVCNVYLWSGEAQTRLLTGALVPEVEALRRAGLAGFFWFIRFDARGPHLMAILDAPEARRAETAARLRACLDAHLAAHPCTLRMEPAELEARHAGCRGKQLCAIDAEPGLAVNNTYSLAVHGADGYPFRAARGVARSAELWRVVGDLCSWAVGRLGAKGATGAGVLWLAAVDRALVRSGAPRAGFWEYHAGTLLPGLGERLELDRPGVLRSLPRAVGPGNSAAFDRLWDRPDADPAAVELAAALVELVMEEDGRPPERRHALLREIDHCLLSQLGQPVKAHIPLVLYAWLRSLQRPVPAAAPP